MDFIDAEAKINECDSSPDNEEWENFDSDIEDFIVNEEVICFGPKPCDDRPEGEGCSTDTSGVGKTRKREVEAGSTPSKRIRYLAGRDNICQIWLKHCRKDHMLQDKTKCYFCWLIK